MNTLTFKRWTFRADAHATRLAHDSIEAGSPERCGCLYCRNFAAARHLVYPPEALALFDQLGVRHDRESETWEGGPVDDGRYFYAGWFHFVGAELAGRDAFVHWTETSGTWDLEALTGGFSAGLTIELALVPEALRSLPVLQLEFQAKVPWVLEEPYPAKN